MSEWGKQLDLFGADGFPEPSRDRIGEIEAEILRIANSYGLDADTVRWKNNRRVMASVGKNRVLNIHKIYQRATSADLKILARVMSGRASNRDRDRFQDFIETYLPRELGKGKSRLVIMPSRGLFHDLDDAYRRLLPLLNEPMDPEPKLGWSAARVGARGITWGTHRDTPEGPLILVNAILDSPDVPNFVVEHIMWHEICHQVVPPENGSSGRRKVHTDAFKKVEACYPRLKQAEKWEQDQVSRLIRRHYRHKW